MIIYEWIRIIHEYLHVLVLNDFKNVLPGQNFSSDWSFVAEAKCIDRIFVGHTH
jgi:hypothetical protein